VAGIAHEVIYRLKEGNSTKWLFLSSLTVSYMSWVSYHPATPERKTATGLVIAPPVWELTDCVGADGVLATKHPKKHQNGNLPAGANNHFINA
jgi:hypothetical protein